MRRRCRWWFVPLLLLLIVATAGGGGVRAQTSGGNRSADAPQGDPLTRSLRVAALQLAAASLSDNNGGIAAPLRLPQRVAVLPLRVERGGANLPMAEPMIRTRFVEFLTSVRHGDAVVLAPLGAKDAAKMARLLPKGVAKGDKPDAKVLDAARKAGADCVLYGTLTPPTSGARDAAWLVNWLLIPVGSGGKDVPVVKASILTTLVFGDGQR